MDLNDDGENEMILVATNPYSCGSIGCYGEILQRRGEQWAIIGTPPLMAGYARLLQRRYNGFRMLFYDGPIVWDGMEYIPYGDVRYDQDH
ncbi:MAG: hypothetical protein FJX68_16690 [Alphaproteobacteria bacterium]|nr:hypothetical protein [Alphaproteobacteria bacterium]